VESNRPIVIPGFAMKTAMFLARVSPMPLLRIAFRVAVRGTSD
jgi:hypothetical protein